MIFAGEEVILIVNSSGIFCKKYLALSRKTAFLPDVLTSYSFAIETEDETPIAMRDCAFGILRGAGPVARTD